MSYRTLANSRGVRMAAKEKPPRQDKPKPQYEKNVVYQSPLTGEFFFARKVKVLSAIDREVIGEKINVTPFIAPYLKSQAELLDALRMILPLAESYLRSAPSSPDNAKLETARAAIQKAEAQ